VTAWVGPQKAWGGVMGEGWLAWVGEVDRRGVFDGVGEGWRRVIPDKAPCC
jgi:hypothetical protein